MEGITDEYTTMIVSGLRSFPRTEEYDYPLLELNCTLCEETFETKPGLIHCPDVLAHIQKCQSRQAKVLLSIGGPDSCNYSLESEEDAKQLASNVWDTYFGGNATERPFDEAVLDGINLDIQKGTELKWYTTFVNTLQQLNKDSGNEKPLVVSVTTSGCEFPNPFVGPAEGKLLGDITPDFVAVRFSGNPDTENCSVKSSAFKDRLQQWMNYSTEKNTRVQLLLPNNPDELLFYDIYQIIEDIKVSYPTERFGGIVFDRIDDTAYPSLFARSLNTMFKNY